MKKLLPLFLIALFFLLSCEGPEKKTERAQGVWGLVSFFDSCVVNRSVARYRTNEASKHAIIVEVRKDSAYAWGAQYFEKVPLSIQKETIATFSKSGGWQLILQDSVLAYSSASQANPLPLRKAPVFGRLLKKQIQDTSGRKVVISDFTGLQGRIAKYFEGEIISGAYYLPETMQTIALQPDRKVKGLDDVTHYQLNIEFIKNSPFGNHDMISLYNFPEGGDSFSEPRDYRWHFSQDTLIFTAFKKEISLVNGKEVETGNYFLTDDGFKIVKIPNRQPTQ
jgi:hypothetical protein